MVESGPAGVGERKGAGRGHGASSHFALGTVLENKGRTEEALAQFEKAVSLDPNHVEAHVKLASSLYQLRRVDEAIKHCQRAIALKPDHAEAYCGLGILLAAVGRLEKARQAFDSAIALAPRNPLNYFYLARLVRFTSNDQYISPMLDLAGNMTSLPRKGQMYLHFTLAKVFSDIGDHERSFGHLLAGNALRRQQTPYDEEKTLGWLERSEPSSLLR